MKKSISTWSFYGDWSLEEKMRLAKAAGFQGFEPELAEEGPISLSSTDADLASVRKTAQEIGIALSGLATGLYWGANPVSADEKVRDKAAAILKKQIECASALGVDTILVVPGAVGADFIPGCEVVPYAQAYERAQKFIQAAVPLAEQHGVTIGVENVWNKFLLSPLEMRNFIDAFQHKHVGSYFDVGNTLATGYPQHWIDILGDRIKRVHFKDYRRAIGTVDGFVDLLSGDIDWPEVMQGLKAIEYDGWVAAEMIPPVPFYKHCPEVLIANTSRAMDAILAM